MNRRSSFHAAVALALVVSCSATAQNFGQELVSAANDPSRSADVRKLVGDKTEQAATVVRDLLRGAVRAADPAPPLLWAERIIDAVADENLQKVLRDWLRRQQAYDDGQRKLAIGYEEKMQHAVAALQGGRYLTAHDAASLALTMAKGLHEPYLIGRALSLRGMLAGKLERWQQAIEDLTLAAQTVANALAPSDARGDRAELARIHETAATFCSARGRYEEALRHIESAGDAWGAIDDLPQLGRCLVMQATTYGELARFADARAALVVADGIFAEPSAARGRVVLAQGLLLLDQGKQALEKLDEARTICRAADDAVGEAEACRHLGRAQLKAGKLHGAEASYRRALELASTPLAKALAHTGRGDGAAMRGDDGEAEHHFQLALAAGEHLAEGSWRAEVGLGAIAERAGDREAARSAYQRAIRHLEALRRMLRLPELRARALTERRAPYARAAALAMAAGDHATAFDLLERLHARTLWEAAAGPTTTRAPSQQLLEIERELAAIETAIEAGPDAERRAALRSERTRLRDRHAAERLRQKLDAPRVDALSHGTATDLAQVTTNLADNEALLTYLVAADSTWCLVTRKNGSRAIALPIGAAELGIRINELLAPIRALRRGETDTSNLRFPARTAALLHNRLIAPLELHDVRRCYIVADGPLLQLPFGMLVSKRERRAIAPHVPYAQYHGCRYLIEDHEIAMLPTAALLTSQHGERAASQALVVGHVLPGTAAEATAVAQVFELGATTNLDPTEATVKQLMVQRGPLHFATHAELDAARPAFARLQLTKGKQDDGWLHAFEIANINLTKAPLVVLSGCDTAGDARQADGLLGLTRAFLVAGASSVVATHWPVADRASAALMADFHRHDRDAVTALAAVQRAMLKRGRADKSGWSHPYFWAGYAVHGAR